MTVKELMIELHKCPDDQDARIRMGWPEPGADDPTGDEIFDIGFVGMSATDKCVILEGYSDKTPKE